METRLLAKHKLQGKGLLDVNTLTTSELLHGTRHEHTEVRRCGTGGDSTHRGQGFTNDE